MSLKDRIITALVGNKPYDADKVSKAVDYHLKLARQIFTEDFLSALSPADWADLITVSVQTQNPNGDFPLLLLTHCRRGTLRSHMSAVK